MKTVYTERHALQDGQSELIDGKLMPCWERPRRAELVIARVRETGLGPVIAPREHGIEPVARVHTAPYLRFLETAWDAWVAEHGAYDALPLIWPTRTFRHIEPDAIDGKVSFFAMDAGTPIMAGTWQAARASADVALTAAGMVRNGERAVFGLCRPPGHHAAADVFGGYCFLNNAAIAAQALVDRGAGRVAILDVDYHHGNGTQAIFYDRPDVLFVSLHGHPRQEFPYFLGYEDETGEAAGEGANLNLPLAWGTDFEAWSAALETGCRRIAEWGPDALVVSVGVDTFKDDPISHFTLESEDFLRIGERIARLGRPTVFLMEGGYAIEPIGINAVNVLAGFEQA
ncbi:histone deacetylase family protein [Marinivivus vitaminiproducens]|uniref:histone deacetylase family protein n=1 Tax=Marinivivus vitaminiproducens TaxID=3035935 RepID=UPI00279F71DD|nr:histone deacetylase family protein [Geminicoccaceae bacterium SCSIO 64248]